MSSVRVGQFIEERQGTKRNAARGRVVGVPLIAEESQRERHMQRVKSPGQAQCFLSAYGPIMQHFRPHRHRFSAPVYRREMENRSHIWQEITATGLAA